MARQQQHRLSLSLGGALPHAVLTSLLSSSQGQVLVHLNWVPEGVEAEPDKLGDTGGGGPPTVAHCCPLLTAHCC